MVRAIELRTIRLAGGGRKLAETFYRPARRVRPGLKRGKPLQGTQLGLFLDETQASEPATETLLRDQRPLLDLSPDAYC
jgi:hypothetical protein